MRVKRTELIAQLKARMDALRDKANAEYAAACVKEADRARAYERESRQAWAALADVIAQRTSNQEPVLENDVPAELRRMMGYGYRPQEPKRQHPPVGELTRLIALLEASPDETVSVPSLERAGFSLGRALK